MPLSITDPDLSLDQYVCDLKQLMALTNEGLPLKLNDVFYSPIGWVAGTATSKQPVAAPLRGDVNRS